MDIQQEIETEVNSIVISYTCTYICMSYSFQKIICICVNSFREQRKGHQFFQRKQKPSPQQKMSQIHVESKQ